jgi:hypothetical protein
MQMLHPAQLAKSKTVDNLVFVIPQFTRFVLLYGKDIPAAAMWCGAFRRLQEAFVSVQTTPVTPGIGPPRSQKVISQSQEVCGHPGQFA